MLTASFLVSTSFVVGKAITSGLSPETLTLVRFIIAALLFAPYIWAQHGLSIPPIKSLARYGLISATIVFFFWCMFEALRYTSALNTSALYTMVPGLAGLYGVFILKEHLDRFSILALLCGMIGALWIIFHGDFSLMMDLDFNRGDLIFLAGCLGMGLYTPLVKLLHRKEPMALMTFWVLVTGIGWLLLISGNDILSTKWSQVELHIWLGITYLAVFTTIITFFLTQFSTLRIGPTRVMAYSYFYPGLVLLIDWMMGRGLPHLKTLPGIFIVLAANIVLQKKADLYEHAHSSDLA